MPLSSLSKDAPRGNQRSVAGIDLTFRSTALQRIGQCFAALGKRQGYRIEAVPLTGGTRAVGKHVAEVAAAARANFLHPNHAMAAVPKAFDMRFIVGFEETRPAGAGIELRVRPEQGQTAEAAGIGAILLVVEEHAAKRRFGAML